MKPRTWNIPLPGRIILGGEQRFPSFFPEKNRGWILQHNTERPSIPIIKPEIEIPGTTIQFFPQFSEPSLPIVGPANYHSAAYLESFSWDWIDFKYQPQKDLEVRSIYWVPDSRVICGESWITNRKDQKRDILVEMVCLLQSHGTGNRILLGEINGRPVLNGSLGDQEITIFLAGNPAFKENPFPYLQSRLSLDPGRARIIRWICILSDTRESAQELLTTILDLDWPGEISRRKVSLGGQLEIITGDPEWDFALAHSKNLGLLKYHQLISPDNGEGITPIQALMLLQSLINPAVDMVKNILDRVFKTTEQPDLTPQLMAGELLWQVHQMGYSIEIWSLFLKIASRWLGDWFSPGFDKDGDGIPELVNPTILDLAGSSAAAELLSENHIFLYPYLESPALGAILYNDLCRIEDLFQISGDEIDKHLLNRKDILLTYLRESWSSEINEFQNRDSHSHESLNGFNIIENLQPGLNILRESFPQPSRIGVLHHRISPDNSAGEFSIAYHGLDRRENHQIEEINSGDLLSIEGFDWGISECVYSKLDYIYLKCSRQEGQIDLIAPTTSKEDITQALPLWAGVQAEQQTRKIIEDILLDTDRYWSPSGFSASPQAESSGMYLFWNLLLGQTLDKLGMIAEAGELVERWMEAIIPTLSSSGSSFPGYGIRKGQGLGIKDSPESLFPVSFFLKVLGIRIFQDGHLIIEGFHPFPWPVTLKFRGIEIKREGKQTIILRPGKKEIILPAPDEFTIDLY